MVAINSIPIFLNILSLVNHRTLYWSLMPSLFCYVSTIIGLFLKLKYHYKHVLNSPQYISGFQTLSPCQLQQWMVIVRLQSFSQFRVIITLYEMIRQPRLKTEPYVRCFLLFLFLTSTLRKSSLSYGHFAVDKYWF